MDRMPQMDLHRSLKRRSGSTSLVGIVRRLEQVGTTLATAGLLLLTPALVSAQVGVSVCACSPRSYTFTFNLSQTCDDDIILGSGILNTECTLAPFQNDSVTDLEPTSIESIDILELDENLVLITQSSKFGPFRTNETFEYVSITDNPSAINATNVPKALQLSMLGNNVDGESIYFAALIIYITDCDDYSSILPQSKIGVVTLTEAIEAAPELCPRSLSVISDVPSPSATFAPFRTVAPSLLLIPGRPTPDNITSTAPNGSIKASPTFAPASGGGRSSKQPVRATTAPLGKIPVRKPVRAPSRTTLAPSCPSYGKGKGMSKDKDKGMGKGKGKGYMPDLFTQNVDDAECPEDKSKKGKGGDKKEKGKGKGKGEPDGKGKGKGHYYDDDAYTYYDDEYMEGKGKGKGKGGDSGSANVPSPTTEPVKKTPTFVLPKTSMPKGSSNPATSHIPSLSPNADSSDTTDDSSGDSNSTDDTSSLDGTASPSVTPTGIADSADNRNAGGDGTSTTTSTDADGTNEASVPMETDEAVVSSSDSGMSASSKAYVSVGTILGAGVFFTIIGVTFLMNRHNRSPKVVSMMKYYGSR